MPSFNTSNVYLLQIIAASEIEMMCLCVFTVTFRNRVGGTHVVGASLIYFAALAVALRCSIRRLDTLDTKTIGFVMHLDRGDKTIAASSNSLNILATVIAMMAFTQDFSQHADRLREVSLLYDRIGPDCLHQVTFLDHMFSFFDEHAQHSKSLWR